MIKKLLKLSVSLVLVVLLSASSVMASGKMEVKLGEKVTLQAQDTSGGSFKWVAKKGKEIITTQNNSIFDYTFNQQGEYDVNLTITDASGKTKSTSVLVLVGDRYKTSATTGGDPSVEGGSGLIDSPLTIHYETLPAKTSQRTIHILGEEGRVVFDIASRDDILEYRIDRNIFADSDGNGIANDDIDNADHSSYLLGGVWQTKYLASESNKIAAEITVVNRQGQKAKSQVEIVFDSLLAKEGNVVAVLDTLPILDAESKKIYVYDELDTVAFYSRRSQGDIIEYRIDKNVFVDSDGDGNPANDIDNRTDQSFKTGDVWTTAYNKTDEQVIAQLIVVGRGGTGSRIQREIAFTDRPVITVPEGGEGAESIISLQPDKEFVQKGDPINFAVEGLSQSMDNYIFDWDFNGDGEVDQTVEGDNTVSYIYDTAGIQPVKVGVRDLDGNEATFTLDFLVKDVAETTADFDFSVAENGTVSFTNISMVSPNLSDKTLRYTWSFGDPDVDNYEAQKDQIGQQNPVYTYTASGTYVVTLTVVDSDQVTSKKTAEVVVEEIAVPENTTLDAAEADASSGVEGGSIIWTIVKIILYVILAIVLLVILIILGLLAFLKIQHPDLVFEELIDELKIKLLAMMGVHEMIESEEAAPVGGAVAIPEVPAEESIEPETDEEAETPIHTEVTQAESSKPELAKQDAPVPDWLKSTTPAQVKTDEPEVIEGEAEEVSGQSESASEPTTPVPISKTESQPAPEAPTERTDAAAGENTDTPPKQDEGTVPDWLKNA